MVPLYKVFSDTNVHSLWGGANPLGGSHRHRRTPTLMLRGRKSLRGSPVTSNPMKILNWARNKRPKLLLKLDLPKRKHKDPTVAEKKICRALRLLLERLIKKVKGTGLVRKNHTKPFSSPTFASMLRKKTSYNVKFILSYGTKVIHNSLSMGVEPIQHLFINQPKHGIFYMDESQRMFF